MDTQLISNNIVLFFAHQIFLLYIYFLVDSFILGLVLQWVSQDLQLALLWELLVMLVYVEQLNSPACL